MPQNENAVNAPSPEQILKDMDKKPLIVGSTNGTKEIDELLSGYKEKLTIDEPAAQEFVKKKRGRPSKGKVMNEPGSTTTTQSLGSPEPIESTALISGALLVMLIDLALPNLVAMINNKFSKSKKIKASALQMSEEQRKELEPIADQVAREMSLKANPLTVLIVSMIGIYGINFMMLKSE